MVNFFLVNNKIKLKKCTITTSDNIYWVFGVLLNPNSRLTRDKVVKKLSQKNIQTRNFFYPMHKQKIFQKLKIFSKNLKYPNSEFLSKNGFYLPSGLGITNKEIKYVCSALNLILS